MLQSYVHIAVDERSVIVAVKVSAYYDDAPTKYWDRLTTELGKTKFTLISYPALLPNRSAKPFKRFIDMRHTTDVATRDIIGKLAKQLCQGVKP